MLILILVATKASFKKGTRFSENMYSFEHQSGDTDDYPK